MVQPHPPARRAVVGGFAAALGLGRLGAPALAQARLKVAALFAGRVDDAGFMEAGYRGLVAARERLGVEIAYLDGVPPQRAALEDALRRLARTGPDLVVAHGGQNDEAARTVAAEFPAVRFVVTQGGVTGSNLAGYEVLQEHSAWLAGALAGLITRSGVVGHMSGIRVAPGLKGRAAFAGGVGHTNPAARLLTNFSGDQDNNALSRRVAAAMADAGMDVLFTMLNAGRQGAIELCRERRIPQIGNVRDWVAAMPDVFVASAVADSGAAVFAAMEDLARDRLRLGTVHAIGLERPEAVRLVVAPSVPGDVRRRVEDLAADVVAGRVAVPTRWSGEEFPTPA